MTPAELTRQIDALRRESAALAVRRGPLQDELARALTVEGRFFNQRDVDDARAVLARIDRDVANLAERIGALTAQLPSSESRAAAEANATTLRTTADAACGQLPGLEAAFIAKLNAAEVAARELARGRSVAEGVTANLSSVVRDFSLPIVVPTRPTPSADAAELARHITMLLMNVAEGMTPDATVEQYLKLIRARMATAALAPA